MNRPRWIWTAILLLLLVASSARPQSPEGDKSDLLTRKEREWLAEHPEIRLAPAPYYPPMEFFDEDRVYSGISADHIKLIEQKLDFEFEVVQLSHWQEVLEKARQREVDVICSLQITPERTEYLLFTERYIEIPMVIIVRESVTESLTLEDMTGMKITVVEGDVIQRIIANNYSYLDVDLVSNQLAALLDVSSGVADATITDMGGASFYIEKEGITNLRIAGKTGYVYNLAFASRSDWPVLNQILVKGLARISEEEREDIYKKWIHLGDEPLEVWQDFLIPILISLGTIVIIMAGVLTWNISLKRQVDLKTKLLDKELVERVRTEEALGESERKLSTLMGNLPGMAYRCMNDPDWTMEFVSNGAQQLTGYAPEDLIQNRKLSYNDLIRPNDHESVWDQVQEALTQRKPFRLLYRIRTESGEEKWVWEQGVGVFSDKGELQALEGFIIDITERKQAEQALLWESEFNAAVAALSSKLIQDEPIEEISHLVLQHAKRLTGSEFGFVGYIDPNTGYLVCPTLTRDIWDVCQVEDKDAVFKEFRGMWGWALNNRKPLLTNTPGADSRASGTPAGHVPIHRFLSAPALIGDDLVGQIGLANSDYDYTDRDLAVAERLARLYAIAIQRKRGENELRKYRDHLEELVTDRTRELKQKSAELEEADRLKSVFLASMSHELRTPLNSIIGFTGIILQGMSGEINEEQRKQLTMVKNSANHLLSLINDLLDISKIEAGRVDLSFETFEIHDVITEVVEAFTPVVEEKGLELTSDVPEGVTFASDRRRVKQVLMNFLSNAVKFTDRGSVMVTVRIKDDKIEISVIDTGIGIKEADMGKLFQPFQQIDSSLSKRHEGTGLGLHLTQKLADLLGGNVSAKSEFGKGSEFIFTVPLKSNKVYRDEKSIGD